MIDLDELCEEIAHSLYDGARLSGGRWWTRCPAHDDTHPSLSVSVYNGFVDLKCWSHNCRPKEIGSHLPPELREKARQAWVESKKLSSDQDLIPVPIDSDPAEERRFPGSPAGIVHHPQFGNCDLVYWFVDECGGYRYCEARWGHGKEKQIRVLSWDLSSEEWLWKQPEDRYRVIYKLREVREGIRQGREILFVEGPKDADRLFEAGIIATTIQGGSSRNFLPQYNEALEGANLIILPDNDAPGFKFAERIQAGATRARFVDVVNLPDLPPAGDVSDYLDSHSVEELKQQLLGMTTASDWQHLSVAEPDPIIHRLLNEGNKAMIVGPSKTRKTFFSLQLALCVATGTSFLGRHVFGSRRVTYVNFELREEAFVTRTRDMIESLNLSNHPGLSNLAALHLRGKERTLSGIFARARRFGSELIIIDPLYMIASGDENSARDTQQFLAEVERYAEGASLAVVVVHHDSKGGYDRPLVERGCGSSVLGRYMDVLIGLSPHQKGRDLLVVEYDVRDYETPHPNTAEFIGGRFLRSEEFPEKLKLTRGGYR